MRALGEALGSILELGDVVSLTGDLGAGKTTLVQGAARGLGVGEGPADLAPFDVRQFAASLVGDGAAT